MSVTPARMYQRRRTAAQWAAENPTLAAGEIGVVTDSLPDFKIGDGSTAWNDLESLPELAVSDPAKVPIATVGGVTTLNVDGLAELTDIPTGDPSLLTAKITSNATPVNNSLTLVDITGLVVALAASSTYMLDCIFVYTSSQVADIRIGWTVPSGATGNWAGFGIGSGATTIPAVMYTERRDFTQNAGMGGGTGPATFLARPCGVIVTTNAGNLQARYAQNSVEATDTTVLAGSTITARKLA